MADSATHARPRLTIGMACYDDFNGVYFSIQALELYHAEVMDDVEFLVVDNNPDSAEGKAVRDFMTHWVKRGRYIAAPGVGGTAAPRERVFREARGEAVLCMDCHVLIVPGAIHKLLQYYDAYPDCKDLLQGPLLYNDCKSKSTHMDPVWRDAMFGIWGRDPRGEDANGPPFEIPMHGCGLMSCRKEAWPGFHPDFRGFGGEEGYIHEKFRRAEHRTLCLPFLCWLHRFQRPQGVRYRLTGEDKLRNYLLGRIELGQPIDDVLDHLAQFMRRDSIDRVLAELGLPSLVDCWFRDALGESSEMKKSA